ncbi:hypothetical protein DFJ73DRAFT_179343 [Zopfochytrium polystomum]|nr:hypothetical protein DFJ73DRAFT_179343 [Zopfochytrium polystomum]
MRFSSNYWSKFSFPSIFHRSTARAGTNPDLGTLTKVSNVTRGNLQAEDCKITETFHLANSSGHPSASSKSCNGTVEPRSLTFDQLVTAQSPQWIRVDAVTGLATLSHFLQLSMASFASGGLLKVNQQDVLTSKLLGGEGGTLFSFCPSPRGSSFFSLISNDSKLFSNGRCERWSFICLCHWPADLDEKSPHLKVARVDHFVLEWNIEQRPAFFFGSAQINCSEQQLLIPLSHRTPTLVPKIGQSRSFCITSASIAHPVLVRDYVNCEQPVKHK